MENHHFQWVNPLYMAIFNSCVSHNQRLLVKPQSECSLVKSTWVCLKIGHPQTSHSSSAQNYELPLLSDPIAYPIGYSIQIDIFINPIELLNPIAFH